MTYSSIFRKPFLFFGGYVIIQFSMFLGIRKKPENMDESQVEHAELWTESQEQDFRSHKEISLCTMLSIYLVVLHTRLRSWSQTASAVRVVQTDVGVRCAVR